MTDLNDFIYTDGVDDVMAEYVNRLLAATLRSEYKNVETLAADKELTDGDTPIQRLDCDGSSRIVSMPTPDATENHPYLIINASDGSEMLTIKNNGETLTLKVLVPGDVTLMVPDGTGNYLTLSADLSPYLLASGLTEWDEQGSDPSTPASGKWKLYFKAGGAYVIDDAGVVSGPLVSGPLGGGITPCFARLSVVSGTPNPTSDYTAQTSVYAMPSYGGCTYPQWDGAEFNPQIFTEQTLALNSAHVAAGLYDVYLWLDGSTQRVVTGPAWSTTTSRGTGAGTAEVESVNGVDVNKVSMTVRNGATTYTMPARYGTLIGTIMPSANGQVDWSFVYRGICNKYNRLPAVLKCDENTSHTYSTTTPRKWNSSDTNNLIKYVLCDLNRGETSVMWARVKGAGGSYYAQIYLYKNGSSIAYSSSYIADLATVSRTQFTQASLGYNYFQLWEMGNNAGSTFSFMEFEVLVEM